jgi:putative flippase GtrA
MRVVRYFFVGAVAATVDIGLFTVFARLLGYDYLIVAGCTFVLATLVNYWLSVRHVFESGARFGRSLEVALVFAVSAIGLAINQGVMFVAVDKVGLDLVLSKILATGIVFLWNYQSRANFVFKGQV